MNKKTIYTAAMAVLSSALVFGVFAQGPVGDEVKVTFDRAVQVGSQTLPAGDYTIKQVTSASNPRVLEFRSQDGSQLNATVTAIPIMQNTPSQETRVILQDEGGGARVSRIWVQGKTYGYAFPGSAMSATQTAATNAQLTGTYSGQEATQNTVATAERSVETTVATPSTTSSTPIETPAETPTTTAEAATPTPAPAQQPAPDTTASTQAPASTPSVPATGLGWVDVMATGLTMAGAGLLLHKREARRS